MTVCHLLATTLRCRLLEMIAQLIRVLRLKVSNSISITVAIDCFTTGSLQFLGDDLQRPDATYGR